MPDRFPYVKRGYDPSAVDRRIDDLELAMREYREKDASITNAIMSAQLAADEIIRKAKTAAEAIMENARAMSVELTDNSSQKLSSVVRFIQNHRKELTAFKDDYEALLSKYYLALDVSEIAMAEKKAGELEAYLQKFIDAELKDASSPPEDNNLA
ncbi:MAG: DivIVA domain-containing protein [Clostridiales bacterium]|jgi:cell division septum initiation protein DivIVA|nr:DivIVA domain-containing protein [Clostridiales bacterium]